MSICPLQVHPNTKAKSGKFDCATMSLSVLLDYRTDDNKEGTFEVSLFAELFNEMLMRDCGFELYRSESISIFSCLFTGWFTTFPILLWARLCLFSSVHCEDLLGQ